MGYQEAAVQDDGNLLVDPLIANIEDNLAEAPVSQSEPRQQLAHSLPLLDLLLE